MIKIGRATPGHLHFIEPKDIYMHDKYIFDIAAAEALKGQAISVISSNEEILAIIGYLGINDGAVELWALTSKLCSKYSLAFHRTLKKHLEIFIKANNLRRVQMTVSQDYSEGIKWAKALGFEPEGILRKYGPDGSDYIMMGRVC
jgi:hypothetical protein